MTLTLPPGLLAAALLFWGWRTGLWLPALPMALLLELAPRITWRWALDDNALARVIDLSALLWVGALIMLFTRYLNQPPLATHLYTLLRWIPLLLFLPLAMQRYCTAGAFRVGHLLYLLRRSKSVLAQQALQLDTPYFVCCLLAAGVTMQPGFLPGVGLLLLWLLLAARPRRHRWPLTLTLVVVAALVAWPLSAGLHRFQLAMEDTFSEWFEDWFIEVDPYRARTALGDIGELKLSGRIVLRLKPGPGDPGPWLLRDAAYNSYFDGVWQAKNTRFTDLKSTGDGREWRLLMAPERQSRQLAISLELRRGTGMLPVPPGAWQLDRLPVGELQISSLWRSRPAKVRACWITALSTPRWLTATRRQRNSIWRCRAANRPRCNGWRQNWIWRTSRLQLPPPGFMPSCSASSATVWICPLRLRD